MCMIRYICRYRGELLEKSENNYAALLAYNTMQYVITVSPSNNQNVRKEKKNGQGTFGNNS